MKKLLALMLALFMFVSLVGCGGGGSTEAPAKEEPASDAQEAPAEEAPAEEAAEEAPAEEAPAEGLKIGACVMDLSAEYFSESVQGYEQWISEHPENELTVVDGQANANKQVEAIENFITAGMDCILLNAVDPEATSDVVKRAVDAGIKVMQYPDADYVTVGLCNDDYHFGYIQGEEAAKWINEKLGGEATVMFLWHPTNAALAQRYDGQMAALLDNCDESKLTLLEPQSTLSPMEATTATENILAAHPETRVILCPGDDKASAVCEVLKAKGIDTTDWFVSGIDGNTDALDKIKDGTYGFQCSVGYTLRTPDIAYDLIDNVARAARGEEYAAKYYQDVIAVTPENIDEYRSMVPTYEDRFENYYNYWLEKDVNS